MPKKSLKPIPTFYTREEEANFLDTHDLTDYFDLRFPKKTEALTVRMDPETLRRLAERAKEGGIAPSALVRTWIDDKLGFKPAMSGFRADASQPWEETERSPVLREQPKAYSSEEKNAKKRRR